MLMNAISTHATSKLNAQIQSGLPKFSFLVYFILGHFSSEFLGSDLWQAIHLVNRPKQKACGTNFEVKDFAVSSLSSLGVVVRYLALFAILKPRCSLSQLLPVQ